MPVFNMNSAISKNSRSTKNKDKIDPNLEFAKMRIGLVALSSRNNWNKITKQANCEAIPEDSSFKE